MARSNQGTGATNASSTSDTATNPPNSQQDTQVIPTGEMETVIQPVQSTQPAQSSSLPSAASTAAPTSQAISRFGNNGLNSCYNHAGYAYSRKHFESRGLELWHSKP